MGDRSPVRGRRGGPLLWAAALVVPILAWTLVWAWLRLVPASSATGGVAPIAAVAPPNPTAEATAVGATAVGAVLASAERLDPSAGADPSGVLLGRVAGRVTGLPASVLARAHPSAGLVLWWNDEVEPNVVHAPLNGDGRFEAADLKPGLWTLKPFKDGGFSFTPREIEIVGGDVVEVTLAGSVRIRQAFSVRLEERGLLESRISPWDLSVRDAWHDAWDDGAMGSGEATFGLTESVLQVERMVLPGPVRFRASASGVARRHHFPLRMATTTVDVPADPEGDDPIEVTLTFDAPGPTVRVSGRVKASAQHLGYRIEATRLDGTAVRQSLQVDVDGGFAFMVDLSAIAGPQLSLVCALQNAMAGPFALDGDGLNLGELTFVKSRQPPPFTGRIFGVDTSIR